MKSKKLFGLYIIKDKISGISSMPILCADNLELWKVLAEAVQRAPSTVVLRDNVCFHIADYDSSECVFKQLDKPEYVINLEEISTTLKEILEKKEGAGDSSPASEADKLSSEGSGDVLPQNDESVE